MTVGVLTLQTLVFCIEKAIPRSLAVKFTAVSRQHKDKVTFKFDVALSNCANQWHQRRVDESSEFNKAIQVASIAGYNDTLKSTGSNASQ